MNENLGIYTDPTDNHEEVKEYTAEEKYYLYLQENEVQNEITEFVEELGRTIKAKNHGIKKVLDTMESTGRLTHYINQLKDILKT